ncbi:unnamed protein product [marine sediment metagenome]|uniref:Uncharacterized protein n=1 Tax=marine sediment metagenome TaxID=412755 RepID=X1RNX9_9ZZZZ
MRVVKSLTAPVKGIGKPDYTREVSSGRERAGLSLKYNQSLVTLALLCTDEVEHPYDISWVKDLIPIGGSSHLYNVATGVVTPYALPVGYTLNLIQIGFAANEDVDVLLYYDTLLVLMPGATFVGGGYTYANMVVPFNTAALDPRADDPHLIDIVVKNKGEGPLKGGFTFVCIQEAVGTSPLPDTKDCQCPFCSNIQNVKVGTTKIICDKCGRKYLVQDFTNVREF